MVILLCSNRMSSDPENPLLLDVLTASSTSYTANPNEATLTEVSQSVFIERSLSNGFIVVSSYGWQTNSVGLCSSSTKQCSCWFRWFIGFFQ